MISRDARQTVLIWTAVRRQERRVLRLRRHQPASNLLGECGKAAKEFLDVQPRLAPPSKRALRYYEVGQPCLSGLQFREALEVVLDSDLIASLQPQFHVHEHQFPEQWRPGRLSHSIQEIFDARATTAQPFLFEPGGQFLRCAGGLSREKVIGAFVLPEGHFQYGSARLDTIAVLKVRRLH